MTRFKLACVLLMSSILGQQYPANVARVATNAKHAEKPTGPRASMESPAPRTARSKGKENTEVMPTSCPTAAFTPTKSPPAKRSKAAYEALQHSGKSQGSATRSDGSRASSSTSGFYVRGHRASLDFGNSAQGFFSTVNNHRVS